MKTIAVIPALLLSCSMLKAQGNFVKGYVVNEKGDTLKGEVRLNPKKEQEIYTKVFLRDANGMQKNYKPEKTKGYGYEDKRFVSGITDNEARFFLVIIKGPVSLYKTVVESMKMNETVFESVYFLSTAADNIPVEVKESKFKKQIGEIMKDNPEIVASYAEEKKFDLEKATDLINRYNSWKSGK
jgi:hypothetical protein